MHHLLKINKLFLILFGLLTPMIASATCQVQILNSSVTINWNPGFTYQMVSLSVMKLNTDACTVHLGFTKGQASDYNRYANYGSNQAKYQLYQSTAFTTPLEDGLDVSDENNQTIPVTFPAGANVVQIVTYYVQIQLSNMTVPEYKPAGTYTDNYSIEAYDNDIPFSSAETASTVNLTINVSPILEVSLVNTGAPFDPSSSIKSVSLGDLTLPQQADLDLKVKTNQGYKITVSSVNGGKLKNTSSNSNSVVPYTMKLNTAPISVTTTPTLMYEAPSINSTTDGVANHITINTTPVYNVSAGTYTDKITLTIDADN
jgi:hypothetical protein